MLWNLMINMFKYVQDFDRNSRIILCNCVDEWYFVIDIVEIEL